MRKVISTILALFLTMLCLADIGLWLRGYSTGDSLAYYWPRKLSGYRFIDFQTAGGSLRIFYGELFGGSVDFQLMPGLRYELMDSKYLYNTSTEGEELRGLGFQYWRLDSPDAYNSGEIRRHFKSITFPHAALVFVLALYPLRFAWKIRRKRKRAKLGLCPSCGYDLRASQGSCPECGSRSNLFPGVPPPSV